MEEGCVIKNESRKLILQHKDKDQEITNDTVAVSLMADLADKQECEAAQYIQTLQEQVSIKWYSHG